MGTPLARLALVLLLLSGCTARPESSAPAPAFNATDVMYLQMSLEQIREGDQVVELAGQRAADERVRTLAVDLRGQWHEEAGTMERWLLGWQQPLTADPSAGAHAGHGELHMLRPSDMAALREAEDFDGTAVSLLLGHLGNCVETARMETAGGAYPPARTLADRVVTTRHQQVQALLRISAEG